MDQLRFPSPTAEAKYHILNYLSENGDVPHSCCEITQAVQQQNKTIENNIIRCALYALCHNGKIIKPFPGVYQINDNSFAVGPDNLNILPTPTIASILEKALTYIESYKIKVADIDNPEAFLHNSQILLETQAFIEKQISRLK